MSDFLDTQEKPGLGQPSALPGAEQITGKGVGAVEQNPLTAEDELASPEEQAEYEDAFRRVMAMIHDTDERGGKKSIADGVIKQISNSQIPSYQAIGKAAGNLMRLFHENAKRQGKEYSGDVLLNVGLDLVTELIDMARELGVVKDLPEEDSPQMEEFQKLASLEAAKLFGDYQLDTGQADIEGEQKGMTDQMEREATSGELDDWNMQEMDPNALQNALAQKGGFA